MYYFILAAVLMWLVHGPTSASAQGLYKWVDSRGVVHYSNTPTNTKAKTVDDALPPAANFQRPAPPPEPVTEMAKPNTGDSGASANAPQETSPGQATDEPAPTPQPAAMGNQEPTPPTSNVPR